jgi:Phage portal protein
MGLLTRMFPLAGFAGVPPVAERAHGVDLGNAGIASRESGQLGPFTVPEVGSWWLTRRMTWRVPAAAQGLQIIAGTLSTLPLYRWRDAERLDDATLIAQPDPAVPTSSMMFQTVEDLILFPYAYWLVMGRSLDDGRPIAARYVPADMVTDRLDRLDNPHLRYADVDYRPADVIRFPSPTPGLLITGQDALRTAYLLERAAQRNADEPIPTGYLQNTGGVDLDDDEIDDLLDGWGQARRQRSTAYLNANTKYETTAFDAKSLQLVEAREQAAGEIARLLNLPPRYVNAPLAGGSSLTYQTLESARRDLVDLSLSVYMKPLTDRLSMDDLTPRGQQVRFSLIDFYRSDLPALVTLGAQGTAAGLFSVTEWRRWAGLPDTVDEGIAP